MYTVKFFLVSFFILLYLILLYLIISLYNEVPDIKNNSIGFMLIYLYNLFSVIVGYIICFLLLERKRLSILINIIINFICLFLIIYLKFDYALVIAIQIVLFLFYYSSFQKDKKG